ncbi:TonB-dependent receptor [Algibacillus agarilyticus]|uniref:TonB-dependent receptor n=1 Tax=Algibacillus agarilyticus TaxID=2234133 RepID=UPI000DCFCBD4|nr:TonB-dependent receptor [Algibacillus agarilyticus]
MKPTFTSLNLVLVGILTAFNSSFSFAEDAELPLINELEKITVYAQKRKQNLNDVSVSVSVLDEELIKQLTLKDSTQLSAQIPNVKITANTGEGAPPVVNIRGVGSLDYNNTTTAPVAFYIDNVVGGTLSNSLLYLFDMERVEVLKGPQGTLFGRNTTGGAVLLQSKRPDHELGGYVTLGLANQNHQKLEAVANVPLSDNTAARVGISHQDYDYSSNNLEAGVPQAGMRQNNFKLLVAHTSDKFDALFKLHAADWDGIVKPVHSKGVVAIDGGGEWCSPEQAGSLACSDNFGFNDGSADFHDVKIDNHSPHTTERQGGSAELTYRLSDDTAITSITSFNQLDRLHTFNCDASPSQLCDGDLGVDDKVFTQELRVNHEFGAHYFIGGLFFIDEAIKQNNQIDLFRDFRSITTTGPAHFFYDNQIDIQSIAAFSQVDYALNSTFTLTTGLRFTSEETQYRATSMINIPTELNDFTGTVVDGWDLSGKQASDEFSGKIALVQKLSPDASVYYSVNRGFKSGGYNGALAFSYDEARLAEYGPETLTALEMGSHIQVNQNVQVNAAAFHYDYNDQQVFMNQQSTRGLSAPAQVLDNVGESTIYGAEIDVVYTPTQNWLWQFGLGYLPEANLKEYIDVTGNTAHDNRLPFTSEWNANGLVNYQLAIAQGTLTAQLEFDYQSKFYFDQNQNPYAKQDAVTLFNSRVSYELQNLEVALWIKNLTDEEYSQIVFDMSANFGTLQDLKAEARRVGIELSYQF